MAISNRFVAKNGLDNSANSITNLGVTGSSVTMAAAHSLTFTTTGATNVTFPTSGTLATTASVPSVGDGTLTLAVSGTGLSGSATFTANQSGNSTFTVTSNATDANTASTIVARDASGNFSAGTITATLSGNASSATTAQTLTTGRTFSVSGDAAGTSSSFDGSANATIPVTLATVNSNVGQFAVATVNAKGLVTSATNISGDATTSGATLTLATVNSSPQSDQFRKVTVNGKGLVTATSAVGSSDITTALGYTPVNKNGDTMTGALILNADPTNDLGAATKQYVDNVASGLNIHNACVAGTTANLTATYNNGSSGVGATLTGTGALPTIDGVTLAVGNRVLVKNQTTQTQNGIYVVTQTTANWIMTRAADFDGAPTSEIVAGDATFVQQGTTLAGTQWVETTTGTITVGTSPIVFSQFGGPGTYTAGTGINISSNTISNTGVTSATAGTGISVSGSTGAVTFTNTGVTSLVAGTNISLSGSTGAVTISATGTVPTATTATNLAGGVAGNVPYQSAANTTSYVTNAAGVLQALTLGATPTWTTTPTLTGTNFSSIPNGALTNSSVTIGSTNIALGGTSTTLAGLSTVTATTFNGALSGNATTATTATNISGGAAGSLPYQTGANTTSTLAAGTVNQVLVSGTTPSWTGSPTLSGTITAAGFSGPLTGAASANVLKAGDTMTGNLTIGNSAGTAAVFTNPVTGTNASYFRSDNTSGAFYFGKDSSAGGITGTAYASMLWSTASYPILLATNGAERVRIDSSGNMYIGTTTAGPRLAVDSGTNALLANWNSTNATGSYQRFQNSGTSIADLGNGAQILTGGSATDFGLNIRTGNLVLGTAQTERMRIDSAGNVGVGTASATNYGAGYTTLAINNTTAGVLDLMSNGTSSFRIFSNSLEGRLQLVSNAALTFYTNNTEKVRIDASGNLNVGATAPINSNRVSALAGTNQNAFVAKVTTAGYSLFQGFDQSSNNVFEVTSTGQTTLANNAALMWKDSGGTARRIGLMSGTNTIYYGDIDNAIGGAGVSSMILASGNQTSMYVNGSPRFNVESVGAGFGANNLYLYGKNTSNVSGRILGVNNANVVYVGDIDNIGSGNVIVRSAGADSLTITSTLTTTNGAFAGPCVDTNSYTRIVNPGGGFYYNTSSSNTGAIKIQLPVGMTGSMVRMTIKCYEYTTNEAFEIHVGGYNYSVGNTWSNNPFAYIVGNPNIDRRFTVRFGYTAGGKAVIYIGELASTWSYLNFAVTDVEVGYSGNSSSWVSGWVLGFEATAFENVTATITNPQVGYQSSSNVANSVVLRDGSGNFTAGAITATSFNATSTQRVKTAIKDLGKSYLDKFAELKPREYDRTDMNAHEFGFVAEEMAMIYPEIVATDADGQSAGIDYSRLSAILTAKVQEQQTIIDKLQEQMTTVLELVKGLK